MRRVIEKIAHDVLHISTLDQRGRDSLDFHDCSVWSVRAALEAAYMAGARAENRALRKALRTLIDKADHIIAAIDGTKGSSKTKCPPSHAPRARPRKP